MNSVRFCLLPVRQRRTRPTNWCAYVGIACCVYVRCLSDGQKNLVWILQVGKASDMREQEYMRMQMQQAYRLGDTETAEKLKGRLKADEPVW